MNLVNLLTLRICDYMGEKVKQLGLVKRHCKHIKYSLLCFFIGLLVLVFPTQAELKGTPPQHGVDLYSNLKYPADFKNFDYANPDAPKGGRLVLSALGTFDSLNAFVIKGLSAAGMNLLHPSYLYATLMIHSHDEPNGSYTYIAETVQVAEDRKSVVFRLRPEAKFHDGSPITADDVVFTFNILKEKGNPLYRTYYREIVKAVALGTREVRFEFLSNENKELPVIIGEMPILSKKYYKTHNFEAAGLQKPLGSGPYEISEVDSGKSITYRRKKDWWGENLPVNKGQNNFDEIKIIYFLDPTVALEAFKAGDIDFRLEYAAKNWVKGYSSDALIDGSMIKEELPHQMTQGMQGFVFNLRRPIFQDIRVRKALALAFDFEWANKNLFYGMYNRSNSYFSNSELGSSGLPEGEELELLSGFKDQLPKEIFEVPFKMPVNEGKVSIRSSLKEAKQLLSEAGWIIKGGRLVNSKTGEPFEFEFLLVQPEFTRVVNGYIQNLKILGIDVSLRLVDTSQYTERVEDFDYDMIVGSFPQSESPGNEQIEYWGSKSAKIKGARNYIGVQNPVIDQLIESIIDAPSRESLIQRTRALDRVLLWNFYVVPGYYNNVYRIAYWNTFSRPKILPKYALSLESWWYDPKKSEG